jgi:hypothetical protein
MDGIGQRRGAQGRNRTTDTAIFSRMLYQLSYLGAAGPEDARRSGGYRGAMLGLSSGGWPEWQQSYE